MKITLVFNVKENEKSECIIGIDGSDTADEKVEYTKSLEKAWHKIKDIILIITDELPDSILSELPNSMLDMQKYVNDSKKEVAKEWTIRRRLRTWSD